LVGVLVMDGVHPQAPRTFQIQGPVVDEKALAGRALRHFKSHTKYQFLRFTRPNVARAEEDKKILS
jgi:hypothetical protein